MEVTNPNGALIQGFMRTVRAEDPTLNLVSLDVESLLGKATVSSIDRVLQRMKSSGLSQQPEAEYVERRGILYVSRVVPDSPMNQAEKGNTYGGELILKPLHEQKACVRLISTQTGSLDALRYVEVSKEELPLPDGFAEVDIHAASLNFKVRNIF